MNTPEGAVKAVQTILKYNPNHYKEAGRLGGTAPHKKPRGFAAMDRAKVSAIGKRGGQRRWLGAAEKQPRPTHPRLTGVPYEIDGRPLTDEERLDYKLGEYEQAYLEP